MWEKVRYLVISLTSRCNLRCSYCYHAATEKGMDMGDDLLEAVLNRADNGAVQLIQITGGEPTLVPEKIERVVAKSSVMQTGVQLAIQTNATLLTRPLVRFFRAAKMQVGISLDGPPAVQEQLRGRVDETLKGMSLLEEARVPFRVTTVVSRNNVEVLDQLVLLLAGYRQCRGMGLDLLVDKGRAREGKVTAASPEQLEQGMRTLLSALQLVNRHRRVPLALREGVHLKEKRGRHAFCHAAAGSSLAVSSDGRLYPCGQTMGDASFAMGTVQRPQAKSPLSLTHRQLQSEKCQECPLEGGCPGDCPSRTYYNAGQAVQLACVLYRTLQNGWQGPVWK